MTDEEIFDLAERHGWMDDFGRWNFKDDDLISFALALLKAENVSVNTPSSEDLPETEPVAWINGKELAGMGAAAKHWGASEWKTNLGLKPVPDDVPLYTAPVMSEKNVRVSDKWVGLTDEEIKALSSWWPSYDQMPALMTLARDIEKSLKEKNA